MSVKMIIFFIKIACVSVLQKNVRKYVCVCTYNLIDLIIKTTKPNHEWIIPLSFSVMDQVSVDCIAYTRRRPCRRFSMEKLTIIILLGG